MCMFEVIDFVYEEVVKLVCNFIFICDGLVALFQCPSLLCVWFGDFGYYFPNFIFGLFNSYYCEFLMLIFVLKT